MPGFASLISQPRLGVDSLGRVGAPGHRWLFSGGGIGHYFTIGWQSSTALLLFRVLVTRVGTFRSHNQVTIMALWATPT